MGRAKKKNEGVRTMTEAEMAEMTSEENNPAPAGYANDLSTPEAPAPADTTPPEPPPAEPETPPAPPPHADDDKDKPTDPPAPPPATLPPTTTEEAFQRLETELAKPSGTEDLSKFSKIERTYYHRMRRDREMRQKAEADRDVAIRENLKLKNPPPPPPDPFAGKAADDLLTVEEARGLLAKVPPPAPAEPPAPEARARHYLVMCEREARSAHPDDFDAVMELTELVDNDPVHLKELQTATNRGENPAEVMYQAIKKHKDFEELLPAAQTRVKARKSAAAPPASPAAPAAPAAPTPPSDTAQPKTEAQKVQAALEQNGARPKTTAHASAREGKPTTEHTLEDIAAMSDMEFARLPRHVRQNYLKQHGA